MATASLLKKTLGRCFAPGFQGHSALKPTRCIPSHVVTDSLVRCPEAGRLLVGVALAAVDHTVRPNLRRATGVMKRVSRSRS